MTYPPLTVRGHQLKYAQCSRGQSSFDNVTQIASILLLFEMRDPVYPSTLIIYSESRNRIVRDEMTGSRQRELGLPYDMQ